MENSRFLRACRGQTVDATPIWLMRQAGRYMPEYRALRERYGILDLIRNPELACEVTMQPIEAFDLDAAIIFADILPLLQGMGLSLQFVRGEGPQIDNPIRSATDIDRLGTPPAEEALPFTLEAIRLARKELEPRGVPLIGFSGAPFTLACYAIEGGSSRHQERAKGLMMSDPPAWHALMTKLTGQVSAYLRAQVQAGAQALQIFDSWCGELSQTDYAENVLPYMSRLVAEVRESGVPVILFGVNTGGLLGMMASTWPDVLGIDWRTGIRETTERLGTDLALQGNLDPIALLGPWSALEQRAGRVLEDAGGRSGYIFNLGHGVLPSTPVDNVRRLVEFVHAETRA
ncbi:MAG: uroporphyrinogen decarboxylase [Chloroflexota bacterium]|nr:uroporphyrinogen decarboxylase [Chloroflexota bacterium]